jgi:hypothetical protein
MGDGFTEGQSGNDLEAQKGAIEKEKERASTGMWAAKIVAACQGRMIMFCLLGKEGAKKIHKPLVLSRSFV